MNYRGEKASLKPRRRRLRPRGISNPIRKRTNNQIFKPVRMKPTLFRDQRRYGDRDFDGTPNILDCNPNNPAEDGWLSDTWEATKAVARDVYEKADVAVGGYLPGGPTPEEVTFEETIVGRAVEAAKDIYGKADVALGGYLPGGVTPSEVKESKPTPVTPTPTPPPSTPTTPYVEESSAERTQRSRIAQVLNYPTKYSTIGHFKVGTVTFGGISFNKYKDFEGNFYLGEIVGTPKVYSPEYVQEQARIAEVAEKSRLQKLAEETKAKLEEAARKVKEAAEQKARELIETGKELYEKADIKLGGLLPNGVPVSPEIKEKVEEITGKIKETYEKADVAVGGLLPGGVPISPEIPEKVRGVIEGAKDIFGIGGLIPSEVSAPDLTVHKQPEVMTDTKTGEATMSSYKAEDYDHMYSQSWLDSLKQAGMILISGKWMDSRKWGTPEQVSIMDPFKLSGTTTIKYYTDAELLKAKEAGTSLGGEEGMKVVTPDTGLPFLKYTKPFLSSDFISVWEPGMTENELKRKYKEYMASKNPKYEDYVNMQSFQTGSSALGEDIQNDLLTKYGNEYQTKFNKLQNQVNEGTLTVKQADDKNKKLLEDTQKNYESEFNKKYNSGFNSLLKIHQKMDKELGFVTTTGKEFAKYVPIALEIAAIVAAPPLGVAAIGAGKVLYGAEAQDVSQVVGGAALVGLGGLGKMRGLEKEFVAEELAEHAKSPMLTDTLKIKGKGYDIDLFKGTQKSGNLVTETTIKGKIYPGETPGTFIMHTGKGFQVTKGELGWNILSKGEGTQILATKSFDIGGKGLMWAVDETGKVINFIGKSTILPQSSGSVLYGTWGSKSIKDFVKSYKLGGEPMFGGTAGFAVKAEENLYYTGSGKLGPKNFRYDPMTGQKIPITVKVQDLGRIQILGGKEALKTLGPVVEISGGGPNVLGQIALQSLGPTTGAIVTKPFAWMGEAISPIAAGVVTGTKTITLGPTPTPIKPEIITAIILPKEIITPPITIMEPSVTPPITITEKFEAVKPGENIFFGAAPTGITEDMGIIEGKIPTGILEPVVTPIIQPPIEDVIPFITPIVTPEVEVIPKEEEKIITPTAPVVVESILTTELDKIITTTIPEVRLDTLQARKQIFAPVTEVISIFKPISPPTIVKPVIGFGLGFKIPDLTWIKKPKKAVKRVKKAVKKPGYYAYAKSKGKYHKLNKVPVTKSRAEDIRNYLLDTSLSATGFIKPTKKPAGKTRLKVPVGYASRSKKKFRDYRWKKGKKIKLKPGKKIELRGRRLDTRPEVKRIHLLKRIAQIKKKVKKKVVKRKKVEKKTKRRPKQIKWF